MGPGRAQEWAKPLLYTSGKKDPHSRRCPVPEIRTGVRKREKREERVGVIGQKTRGQIGTGEEKKPVSTAPN